MLHYLGDMASEESIEASLLKIGEKGKYIRLDQVSQLQDWESDSCEEAGKKSRTRYCRTNKENI